MHNAAISANCHTAEEVMLDHDAWAAVLAVAHPRDAVSLAQACKDTFRAYRAMKAGLKAALNLKGLRISSRTSYVILGSRPYIGLVIPDQLLTLTQRRLTAMELRGVALALRPDPTKIQAFVQQILSKQTWTLLTLQLYVPFSLQLVAQRLNVAPVLTTLVDYVQYDVKAAMSIHAYMSQSSTLWKVVCDLAVIIETPEGQTMHDVYMQIKQDFPPSVLHEVLDRWVEVWEMEGEEHECIRWEQNSGLPALFGQQPPPDTVQTSYVWFS